MRGERSDRALRTTGWSDVPPKGILAILMEVVPRIGLSAGQRIALVRVSGVPGHSESNGKTEKMGERTRERSTITRVLLKTERDPVMGVLLIHPAPQNSILSGTVICSHNK